MDTIHVSNFRRNRRNRCICGDATTLDYARAMDCFFVQQNIDYLSLDIEPAEQTFKALARIPFHKYKFGVITYEHDLYASGPEFQARSRAFLHSLGYRLIIPNVTLPGWGPFEDWWVFPELVPTASLAALEAAFEGYSEVTTPQILEFLQSAVTTRSETMISSNLVFSV